MTTMPVIGVNVVISMQEEKAMSENEALFLNLRQAIEHMIVRYSEEMLTYDRYASEEECKISSSNVECARERYADLLRDLSKKLDVNFDGLYDKEIA